MRGAAPSPRGTTIEAPGARWQVELRRILRGTGCQGAAGEPSFEEAELASTPHRLGASRMEILVTEFEQWPSVGSSPETPGNRVILRPLVLQDESAFDAAVQEFANDGHDFEFAFKYGEGTVFSEYVEALDRWSRGLDLPDEFVPNSFLVGVLGSKIVGRVSIRHVLNDYLAYAGGHVGYGVVPSERRKGLGSELLRLALPLASSLGIQRLLITCNDDNAGSARVIENNQGVFEGLIQDPLTSETKRRYWIDLPDGGSSLNPSSSRGLGSFLEATAPGASRGLP